MRACTPPRTSPRRSLRRSAQIALLFGLVLLTPACDTILACLFWPAACGEGFSGGGPLITAVITRLDTKTSPLELEDDGDPKDVKAKDRKTFKPSKGSEDGLDRRYLMQAKQDDGEACLGIQLSLQGASHAWVRVAVDDTSGLVDGESLAFLERRHENPGEGEPSVVRAEAVWNAKTSGFDVRARVDGEVVGAPDSFPGMTELFLAVASTSVVAYEIGGNGHADFGDASVLAFGIAPPSGAWTVALGAEALGKKGAFWFDELAFDLDSALLGAAEQQIGYPLTLAGANVAGADLLAGFPTGDPGTIAGFLSSAVFQMFSAQSAVLDAIDGDTLGDHVDPEFVEKAVAKALVKINQAKQKADKLVSAGKPTGKGLAAPVQRAREALDVAVAALHGFGSLNGKRLADTIEIH